MPATESELIDAWFQREHLPVAEAAMVTGIPLDVILTAIRKKKVWVYRIMQLEWSYERWLVNVTSRRRYTE